MLLWYQYEWCTTFLGFFSKLFIYYLLYFFCLFYYGLLLAFSILSAFYYLRLLKFFIFLLFKICFFNSMPFVPALYLAYFLL